MISQEFVSELAEKIVKILEGRTQSDVKRVFEVVQYKLIDSYVVTLPKQERKRW